MQESQESSTVCCFFLTIPPLSVSLKANIFAGENFFLLHLFLFLALYYFSLKLPSRHHLSGTDAVQILLYFIQNFHRVVAVI